VAHAARISAEPADGAGRTVGPDRVSATFNERLQLTFAAMTVVGPDGIGPRPLGSAGTYTVT